MGGPTNCRDLLVGHSSAERLIGSIRRECLDHIVVFSESSLGRTLKSCFDYYHGARTHFSLEKDAPETRPVQPPERGSALPGNIQERYFRGDSGCHENGLLGWLKHPDRAQEPGGRNGFAVSAKMSAELSASLDSLCGGADNPKVVTRVSTASRLRLTSGDLLLAPRARGPGGCCRSGRSARS
jgi:hypothetical protein